MSTEPTTTRTPIPRHFIAGMVCGFLAAFAVLVAAAYYFLVGAEVFSEPPRGLSLVWMMAIVVPALVPIGLWCASVAARPLHQRLQRQEERFNGLEAKIQSALDRFGEGAMDAAKQAGRWEGIAQTLDGSDKTRTPADVVKMFDWERNGKVN